MTSINDPGHTEQKIEKIKEFLQALLTSSGLELEFRIVGRNVPVQSPTQTPAQSPEQTPAQAQPQPSPELSVEFTGPDTPLLLARNAELLHDIEHLAAKVLRLEPEEHDRISFDAENFKLLRNRELQLIAEAAVEKVRATGRSYAFPPMNSRERRLLHLALSSSGLPTASTSDGPRRFVVLYPKGQQPIESPQPTTHDRTRAIRNSFRRR
jgi:spoIIIJ-associated protein